MQEFLKDFLKSKKEIEFWIESEEGLEVEKRDCKNFLKEHYSEENITIRVLNENGKAGLSYTTSVDHNSLKQACSRAILLSEYGVPTIFPEVCNYPDFSHGSFKFLSFEEIFEILNEIEDEIFSRFSVKRIEKLRFSCGKKRFALLRKDLELCYELPFYDFVISVVASSGEKEASAYEWFEGTVFSIEEIKERAFLACKKAIALSKTKKGKSLKIPVLFPPFVSIALLELLEFSFLGDEVLKGRSYLKDKLGKRTFSEVFTLYDDGTDPELPETRPFDDEGVAQNKKVLVEKGVVKEFLFNTFWRIEAEKIGFSGIKAGNSRRPDFTSFPKISSTNLYIEKGFLSKEELILLNSEVFEVIEVLGTHTSDPISGDFSLGVSGIYYRRGEPTDYLCEMALSGNLFNLFNNIIEVGSDLMFYGSIGSPSLLVNKMDLGGRD